MAQNNGGGKVVATELIDLEVDRVDAVENPATGRGFLIAKAAPVVPPADDDKKKKPAEEKPMEEYTQMKKHVEDVLKGLGDFSQGAGFGGFPPQLVALMSKLASMAGMQGGDNMFKSAPATTPNQAGQGGSAAGDKGPAQQVTDQKLDPASGQAYPAEKMVEAFAKMADAVTKNTEAVTKLIEKQTAAPVAKAAEPGKPAAPKSKQPEGQDDPNVAKSGTKMGSGLFKDVIYG